MAMAEAEPSRIRKLTKLNGLYPVKEAYVANWVKLFDVIEKTVMEKHLALSPLSAIIRAVLGSQIIFPRRPTFNIKGRNWTYSSIG